jgi:acyl transferase domain-containing protein/acyl carrier protein
MGQQLFKSAGVYREVLLECEELLGPYLDQPLLKVLSGEAGAELLLQTKYTQPALFAVEYALARQWQSWGVEPALLLGHSIGEYVAACVAGAFTLADGLKLVAARGRLMQERCERGAMLAVNASEARVQAELTGLEEEVWIAALNGPEQVVLSGQREVMERVQPRLEARGLRVKRLAVEQGFHSGLMEPMLEEFAAVAREIKYAPLERAVVSNVSGEVKAVGERLESDYWLRQVRETVRFSEGMQRLRSHGCEVYVEVGPQAQLVWLGQQCLGTDAGEWCWSLRAGRDEWEQMLESVGKLYVRGIDVKWEAVSGGAGRRRVALPSYPFQRQRYWIDDSGEGIPRSEPKRQQSAAAVQDWLYQIQWEKADSVVQDSTTEPGNWLLFADRQGVAAALAQKLRAQGKRCVLVRTSTNDDTDYQLAGTDASEFQRLFAELNAGDLPWRIVYLWSLDAPPTTALTSSSLEEWQRMSSAPLVSLVQALLAEPQLSDTTRLWVVTAGAQATGRSGETLSLAQTPMWGLGKVLALEEPQLWGGLIDLDNVEPEHAAVQVQDWIENNGEERVAFRDAVAYVPRMVKLAAANGRGVQIDAAGTYLISGGLGALGLTVAQWLVQRGARRLVLVSRSGLPNAERSEREAVLERLREQGADVQVVSADVGDETAMRAVLEKLASRGEKLKGVIHAAGVLQPNSVGELSEAKLLAGLRGKMVGGWVLQQLTQDLDLDFFISFSSVAAVWGGIRLGVYAAGNEFLTQLAHWQQQHSRGKALTINWGPWEELETGSELEQAGLMEAARLRGNAASEVRRMMDQMGLSGLTPTEGVAALEEMLAQQLPQVMVCKVHWPRFLPIYQARRHHPLFDRINWQTYSSTEEPEFLLKLKQVAPSERVKLLQTLISNEISNVLGLDQSQPLDMQQGLLSMGMDSLMALELSERLQKALGRALSPTLIFNYPTIESLADHLVRDVLQLVSPKPADEEPPANTNDLEQMLAKVEELSDDEAQALLAARLTAKA